MVLNNVRMPPEQIREITLDWLIPLTEDGTMDEIFREFVKELAPFAAAAARQAIRDTLSPSPDVLLVSARVFFGKLLDTLETMSLNPDMMAVSHASWSELVGAMVELRKWIDFLDRRFTPTEATIPPTTAAMMAHGGVP